MIEVFKLPGGGVGVPTGVGVGVAWATELPIPWHPVSKSAAAKHRLITALIFIRLMRVFIFVVPVQTCVGCDVAK